MTLKESTRSFHQLLARGFSIINTDNPDKSGAGRYRLYEKAIEGLEEDASTDWYAVFIEYIRAEIKLRLNFEPILSIICNSFVLDREFIFQGIDQLENVYNEYSTADLVASENGERALSDEQILLLRKSELALRIYVIAVFTALCARETVETNASQS